MSGTRQHSLERRLLLLVLLVQMAAAAVLCNAALHHERHTRQRAFDEGLRGRSDSVVGAIQDAEDPEDNVRVDPAEVKIPAEDLYAVYAEDGRLLGGRKGPPQLLQPGLPGFRDQNDGPNRYRIFQRSALRIVDRDENGGQGFRRPVTIVYAAPMSFLERDVLRAAGFYMVLSVGVVGVTAIVLIFVIRRALRPLSVLVQAAGQLSVNAMIFSPPASVLQVQELRPLAEVLVRVMASLREAFEKERRFLGDAAHELKTAVAIVRSSVQLEMLRARGNEERTAGLHRILNDTGRVESLVGQMLHTASAAELPATAVECIDLRESAAEVVAEFASIAAAHNVQIRCDAGEPAKVRLTPQHARTLLSNLLLNAVQHSQPGTPVAVDVRDTGPEVVLQVTDAGEGIGAAALPHVFERFFREDRSRSRSAGGLNGMPGSLTVREG